MELKFLTLVKSVMALVIYASKLFTPQFRKFIFTEVHGTVVKGRSDNILVLKADKLIS